MLRRRDEVKPSRISDGSATQVTSKFRGGGKHSERKGKGQKKRATGLCRQSRVQRFTESEKDTVNKLTEEGDQHREIVAYFTERKDDEVEQ